MLKKIDFARNYLETHHEQFRCPVCNKAFQLQGYSLICKDNHQFDLSKKGTIYFLSHSIQTEYNKKMLHHRGRLIQAGMYQPLLEKISTTMDLTGATLDVGCGEGSFLLELSKLGLSGSKIGFDISKDGIYLASNQAVEAFWCVADLTNLPFSNQSMDTVLNIFSPSHYQEFKRVLKKDGTVIKVIPEADYLKELRAAFYPDDETKQTYSNEKVLTKFSKEMDVLVDERVTFTFAIPEEYRLDLLEMSPLEWGVAEEVKEAIQKNPLSEITIDVRMLKGKIR
ncbi:ribosomal RNA large subunit methyltransferase A [Enterococcus moraviensis ATCC BAA-383]|uniref:Ribosomal RNA large subunit methyltransferase A n=1 Tax=Enterococcus moraviensis ATCC BAA-383 TaxID=1158609 RepID=R2T1Q9_9ENTE|nr:methyltransferase domain-containing protein [Enterococcus moraviensis]EOH98946.1 ribosomal RNA large subunit methyltransferase A [Enterococcus moraviensis ATCC BAA-383]EOT71879.1 ribosomal RNA large subunit methyltransferase A [Enterococcus moraviensis ATCC BAA-383]OJG67997.1 ribosomal RNA large subunit methyltransferase A [Enterococcus moraviensis]